MEKIKLFCLPYAGGSATMYSKWKTYLDGQVELIPVELAGRGSRIKDPFYLSLSDAIEDIYINVRPHIADCQISFFGHSMGSIIVYELCKKIMEYDDKEPVHIFVSGRYPPHIMKRKELLHTLPEDKFKEEIIKIGGTPGTVFANQELANIFIPILRADYRLIERYEYLESDSRFNCGITVFNGKTDKISTYDELLEWQKHTACDINVYEFEGNHFFIHEHAKQVVEIINSILTKKVLI